MFDLEIERAHGWPHQRVVGVDEAGRGAWMGPVYAGAVYLPAGFDVSGLADSKCLSARQRDHQFERLMGEAACGVGCASVDEIDALNILKASFLAMQRAVQAIGALGSTIGMIEGAIGDEITPPAVDFALIDGNQAPPLPCPSQCVIGGDRRAASIAAASIVAKVSRDRMIIALAADYPDYAWQKNKGYGTKQHRQALFDRGITPHHRRSFAPMRDMSSLGDE